MNTQHLLMNKNEVVIDSNNIIKEKIVLTRIIYIICYNIRQMNY